MADEVNVDGMTLTITDVPVTESGNNVSQLPIKRQSNARGRQAYGTGVCEIHGPAEDGAPCAKFSHLPGNGIGAYKPSAFRRIRSFIVGLIKPFVLIGIVVGALYAGSHFLPNLFTLSNFTPHTPTSVNNKSVSNSNGNGNGDSDRNRDGNIDRNKPTDRVGSTNGRRPKPTSRVGGSVRGSASAIDFGLSRFEVRV